MIRNDFIMRLIELLGVVAARVLRRIEKGGLEGAGNEIELNPLRFRSFGGKGAEGLKKGNSQQSLHLN